MSQPVIQPSFASGELSPTLFARVDLTKYKIGLDTCRNLFVDYRGGASNRPGTSFVGQCKSSSSLYPPRLLPFVFSTIQAYGLEFGDQTMRVIKDGAYVLEATKTITGITKANPGVVTSAAHGFSNGDWVYVASVGGMTQVNSRTFIVGGATANTFTLVDPISTVAVNTTAYSTYTSGGTVGRVYTLSTPYSISDLPLLKFTQSADVMTLVHPSYAPRNLTRTAHNSWTITINATAAALVAPGAPTVVNSIATGGNGFVYQITAIDPNGDESVASTATSIRNAKDLGSDSFNTISWTAVTGAIQYNVYKAGPIYGASRIFAEPSFLGFMASTQLLSTTDNNITPDFSKTAPIAKDPFSPGTVQYITLTAGGSGYTSTPSVSITGGGGSGATARAYITTDGTNGPVVGVVLINPGSGYTSAPTVSFSGGAGTGAAATAVIDATGNWPGVVAYFNQRLTYAASTAHPQTFWMSQPGLYKNFNISDPVVDSDVISATLNSLQVNAIKHLIPMPGGLIALTSYGAWLISGGGQNVAITPSNLNAQAQAYYGAADTPPIVINYDILYVSARGATIRDFSYNFGLNIYTGADISFLSNHMFSGNTVSAWAYADAPFKIVWTVLSTGRFLSLTYLKEQEVLAWARHDTKGLVKSVITIPENGEDAVYFIIQRLLNGFLVNYTERLASRQLSNNRENGWFLDCALRTTLTYPASDLFAAASSGSSIIIQTTSAVFNTLTDVGKILRAGGGIATITSVDSTTQIHVTWTTAMSNTYPDDSTNFPIPVPQGAWSMDSNVTSVSGLWHLEGQTVSVVGDGTKLTNQTVTNGTVTVSTASSFVLVGLPYQSQFKTLRIDLGEQVTAQGKRKNLNALTTRVADSYGWKVGPTFSQLETWNPNVQNFNGTTTNGLYTGDYRRNIGGSWSVEGQICIQQDDPYPLTVLGVIPEILLGDTK